MMPSSTATTGVFRGARMSIASWFSVDRRAWSNVSRSSLLATPRTGTSSFRSRSSETGSGPMVRRRPQPQVATRRQEDSAAQLARSGERPDCRRLDRRDALAFRRRSRFGRRLAVDRRPAERGGEAQEHDRHRDRAGEEADECGHRNRGAAGAPLAHFSNTTGVPLATRPASLATSQLVSRTHPWDAV